MIVKIDPLYEIRGGIEARSVKRARPEALESLTLVPKGGRPLILRFESTHLGTVLVRLSGQIALRRRARPISEQELMDAPGGMIRKGGERVGKPGRWLRMAMGVSIAYRHPAVSAI